MHRSLCLLLALSALLGCQSSSRTVESGLLLPQTAERIEPASNQRFVFPGEFDELAMPDFPAAVAQRESLDVTVCLSFTVSESGETIDIEPETLPEAACDAPLAPPALLDAATRAVDSWEFIAAALCDYETPEQKAGDGDSCENARSVTAIPVRLAWTFRFKAERGVGRVSAREQSGHERRVVK